MTVLEQSAAAPAEALPAHVEIAIVGSGFSGIAMAVRLLGAGIEDFVMLERADEVGGTWRDNAYPGCACDVPSHLYSFSFAPKPDWSSTFSPQGEIQGYLRAVAEEHGVRPHVRFGCELLRAAWDGAAQAWQVETSRGALTARILIAAPGALSDPAIPRLPGIERFAGAVFHSATWDHDHDLTGERVAVVGTGASAIQFVPEIQPRVARLHLFQRTPPWVMPRRARPLTRAEKALFRRVPAAQRLVREALSWGREAYALPLVNGGMAPITHRVFEAHLRRTVRDPELRAKLTPDYAPGCKRILISNDYLPALARPNVEVITDSIAEVRERSIVASEGTEREVDTIIFGTGFQVTDLPIAHRLAGRDGRSMADTWAGSMQAHRGTTVAGFPNLFFLLGPNTGLGHTSVVLMAEAQADYVLQAVRDLRRDGVAALEVRPEAQATWNEQVQAGMRGTVWTAGGCASWYLDGNGRNSTLWPDFAFRFRRLMRRFDRESYVAHPAGAGTEGALAVAA